MNSSLPAQRFDSAGGAHVDWWAVLALAGPLIANSAIQAALNLTDTWFVGHISTLAMAGMGAVHWLVIVFIGVLGGVAMAVQTVVAQAHGARRYRRAAHATWTALWASLFTAPLFVALGLAGGWILAPFALDAEVRDLALQFWQPRMLGAALGVALWSVLGFFNGIGHARVTLVINLVTLSVNAVLAWLFIFIFDWGVPGAAWATNCATAVGLAIALLMFLGRGQFACYGARLTWRLKTLSLVKQFRLGLPMGIGLAADLFGFALFQLMLVKLSPSDGAASQIVMMLTSIAYMPAIGIALAGTTLVGQSIGAGDKHWARRLGNAVVAMAVVYMGSIGLMLGLASGWTIPLFLDHADPLSAEAARIGMVLMWLAAAYQLFDGMILGASFCLRGAGDATVPAVVILGSSWLLFVPLAHSLAFAPGHGFVQWLPQYGLGAAGGWMAAVVYVSLVGVLMLARWRSTAWERMVVR
ncbi:MAG: MATE family efflux transporter [Gammaproteobacteria bacterium]|nr:MATE family efflux transporter [Gammaproteobacteria bacterium]